MTRPDLRARPSSARRRSPGVLSAGAAALALLAAAPGCDNPSCIFGPDGCSGSAVGSSNLAPATVPANGQFLEVGPPTIVARIPAAASTTLHPDSPFGIVFSESMNAASLASTLRIEDSDSGGFGPPIPFASALVAEGRVLLVFPAQPLELGTTYNLVWSDSAAPFDLQGQAFVVPEDKLAAQFETAATEPATVRLLGSFPAAQALHQSGVGEFVAVFDRRLKIPSVTPASFDVKVNGVDPPNDPLARPVAVTTGAVTADDPRAFRWHSRDANGDPAPLGPGAEVDVSLSPAGAKLEADDDSQLAAVHVIYDVAAISPAVSAVIVSQPSDAIGLDNVTGPKTLDIQVDLVGANVGDRLGVFLFGDSVGENPKRLALFRDVALGSTATTVHIGEDELDLATDQGAGRLADGTLSIAIRMQRGSVTTPVTLLDADPLAPGVQSLKLDLTRPTLVGFGPLGASSTVFRSDLVDFALVGRASERLRSVEVSTALGDNGVLTPVVGSTSNGVFVAAPVLVGILTPAQLPLAFTAQIYDDALNAAAAPIGGTFVQLGATGPGAALPGPTVTVEVFDASTHAPVSGALVLVHEDVGGGTVFPVDAVATDAQGRATVTAGIAGETLVTVDAAAFDLFTFEDVPTDRLSVPLQRRSAAPASLAGSVSSPDANFSSFDRFVHDSRRFPAAQPLITVQSCVQNPVTQGLDCAFGPTPIRPNLLGVAALFAVEVPATELGYNAATFLRGFGIALPVAPAASAAVSNVQLAAGVLLDDPSVDPEDRPIDGPSVLFDVGTAAGLSALAGSPSARVEARVRGVPGSAAVGLGAAFDQLGGTWRVRSAYPGAADGIQDTPQDELGRLVADGAIDADLFLAVEARDALGARSGRRPRFSAAGAQLDAIPVPALVAPAPGSGTGGATFDLEFVNAIPDSAGTPGLYVATVTAGSGGRRWRLWRPDLGDGSGATRTIHVPDLAALGGSGLPNGALTVVVEAFGWPGFDVASFQWSDVEREHDTSAASVPVALTQP